MELQPIPIFSDNYVWLLNEGADAVVVDPGDAAPVQHVLAEGGLTLRAILVTHWHPDHIGGIAKLLEATPGIPVYGPRAEAERIRLLSHPLDDGDYVEVLGRRFEVMALPGHTLGHIAYLHGEVLLCGDTLFSAGCGRLFEGTPAQMFASLNKLAQLPDNTKVYCTHEYTTANLAFALAVEPGNADLQRHAGQVKEWRAHNRPSLPSSIGLEKRINPFLRAAVPAVQASAAQQAQTALAEPGETFAALRRWKDGFKAA